MVKKQIARIRYKLKGMLMDRKKFDFQEGHAQKARSVPPKISDSKKHPVPEKRPPETPAKAILHLKITPEKPKIEKSGTHPAASHAKNSPYSYPRTPDRRLERPQLHENPPIKFDRPQPTQVAEPNARYPKYYPKSEFHPYRKKGMREKAADYFNRRGLPPLPIIMLVLVVLLASILPLFSLSLLAFEPREVDLYIAIQQADGNVLKNATIVLADGETFLDKYSSAISSDGTAFFKSLPVNMKLTVYALKDGNRIEVEEREFRVPFYAGRKEIIIVRRAIGG